jgi:hypothetical protein
MISGSYRQVHPVLHQYFLECSCPESDHIVSENISSSHVICRECNVPFALNPTEGELIHHMFEIHYDKWNHWDWGMVKPPANQHEFDIWLHAAAMKYFPPSRPNPQMPSIILGSAFSDTDDATASSRSTTDWECPSPALI